MTGTYGGRVHQRNGKTKVAILKMLDKMCFKRLFSFLFFFKLMLACQKTKQTKKGISVEKEKYEPYPCREPVWPSGKAVGW